MSHQPNFNRLPRLYRWMELVSFGPWLRWCRCAFLGDLLTCRRAVVLGDGDRRFTAWLLKANPAVQIDAIDASSAMLQSLVRRAGPHAGRIRTQVADARGWRPEGRPAKSPENLPLRPGRHAFFPGLLDYRRGPLTGGNPARSCLTVCPVGGLGVCSAGRLVWQAGGRAAGLGALLRLRLAHGAGGSPLAGPRHGPAPGRFLP
jgi:hypothetical protein